MGLLMEQMSICGCAKRNLLTVSLASYAKARDGWQEVTIPFSASYGLNTNAPYEVRFQFGVIDDFLTFIDIRDNSFVK